MNRPKQNMIPLVILSTVIAGSGIAWLMLKSSSKEKGDSENKKPAGRIREAQKTKDEAKQDLSQAEKNQNSSYSHDPHGPFGSD